jgi:hypothetical protein
MSTNRRGRPQACRPMQVDLFGELSTPAIEPPAAQANPIGSDSASTLAPPALEPPVATKPQAPARTVNDASSFHCRIPGQTTTSTDRDTALARRFLVQHLVDLSSLVRALDERRRFAVADSGAVLGGGPPGSAAPPGQLGRSDSPGVPPGDSPLPRGTEQ